VVIDAEYEEIDENSELDLSEGDSLPWLEGDEEDEAAGGLDTAQVIGFAVILLALLLGIVGAIWFMTSGIGDDTPVADGSVIEAPEGPFKTRPEDPGGKEFAGTGNVAPAVGEGVAREGQIAAREAPPPAAKPAPSKPVVADASPQPAASGVAVQLAAYGSRARAEQGWAQLTRQTDTLSGVRHRVVEGVIDTGTVYRLQAMADSRSAADTLCAALRADGLDCTVKP
jgi:hypothetical protein